MQLAFVPACPMLAGLTAFRNPHAHAFTSAPSTRRRVPAWRPAGDGLVNFVCEIPKETSAKMEVATVSGRCDGRGRGGWEQLWTLH